jgi:hypothetical protein
VPSKAKPQTQTHENQFRAVVKRLLDTPPMHKTSGQRKVTAKPKRRSAAPRKPVAAREDADE